VKINTSGLSGFFNGISRSKTIRDDPVVVVFFWAFNYQQSDLMRVLRRSVEQDAGSESQTLQPIEVVR